MTRPEITLITIAIPSDKLARYRAALDANGLSWTDSGTEVALAAESWMDVLISSLEASAEQPA